MSNFTLLFAGFLYFVSTCKFWKLILKHGLVSLRLLKWAFYINSRWKYVHHEYGGTQSRRTGFWRYTSLLLQLRERFFAIFNQMVQGLSRYLVIYMDKRNNRLDCITIKRILIVKFRVVFFVYLFHSRILWLHQPWQLDAIHSFLSIKSHHSSESNSFLTKSYNCI